MPIPGREPSSGPMDAVELVEEPAHVHLGHAGAVVLDRDLDRRLRLRRRSCARPDTDRRSGRTRTAFSMRLVRISSRKSASTTSGGRSAGISRSSVLSVRTRWTTPLRRSSRSCGSSSGLQGAALDPAQVQQVAHEPVHPLGLEIDRAQRRRPLVGRPAHALVEQAARGRPDRRQGCTQVVRDGVQQRAHEALAPEGDLRLHAVRHEPLASDRLAELIGRGRQDPGLGRVGIGCPGGP